MKKLIISLLVLLGFGGCISTYNPPSSNTYNPPPVNNVLVQSVNDISHVVDKDTNSYYIIGIDSLPTEHVGTDYTMTLDSMLTRNAIYIIRNLMLNKGFNIVDEIYDTTNTENIFTVLITIHDNSLNYSKGLTIGMIEYDTGISMWRGFAVCNPNDYTAAQEKYINNLFSLYISKIDMDDYTHW